MAKRDFRRKRRSATAIQRAGWSLGFAAAFLSSSVQADLIWDASGTNPTNPQPGSGFWDTTTNANWSNGSSDTVWTNGQPAGFSGLAPPGTNVTIDDLSGTVIVGRIDFPLSANSSNYTIAAQGGDTLTMSFGGIINGAGTISAPIVGTVGISKDSGGTLTLTGHSTYTGPTSIQQGAIVLGSGASLGNTSISGVSFIAKGTSSAGTGGTGTLGAALVLSIVDGQFHDAFNMIDGTTGTFTVKQQLGFHGTSLSIIGGNTLGFDLSNTTADELINSGPGTAAVSGTNIINISTASAPYLTLGDYPLISVPSGGLTGNFAFANGLTTETVTVGGNDYTLQLTNSDTTETLTVLPEPTGIAVLAMGTTMLLRRHRKNRLNDLSLRPAVS